MIFASRGVSAEGAKALKNASLGPAHARTITVIGRNPGLSVADLQAFLKVAKQSLNRVLSELIAAGYVERRAGIRDRRTRMLRLTEKGAELETAIWDAQRPKLVRAFREAGPDAVAGFRRVLMGLVDKDQRPKGAVS
ncbi:MAG TPA: MarR family transcriptional regulator [Rhizomicrobium sp.]|nr:MarR family transcriptional regulator [Rhizomicrobium sp.]